MNQQHVRRRRRGVEKAGLVGLIGLLLLPTLGVLAQAGDSRSPYLTWDDAPAPPPLRHQGDAHARWGWERPADVFGPFFTAPYQVGDRTDFALGSYPADRYEMELYYRSKYAYFWFEPGARVDMDVLAATAKRFDSAIWPVDRDAFGANANPGIDGDTRIHLVHLQGFYPGYLGFFSPDDQCAHVICASSNERDVIYLVLDDNPFGSEQYLATVAHEFQHLIQFSADGNEYRWLDEAFSQLAEYLNGFIQNEVNDFNVAAFLETPNLPFNTWSLENGDQVRYYGAGYLFLVYLYDRFGLEFIRELARNPRDGLASVHHTLRLTGQTATLNEIMTDWYIANLVNDATAADGRYGYKDYALPADAPIQPLSRAQREINYRGVVNQYGAEYLALNAPGTYTLEFDGDTTTALVDAAPFSGEWMWWSYNAVGAATSLTRTLDLTGLDRATLQYRLWWDTGDFPAYLHVLVSSDNGLRWDPLQGWRMRFPGYDDDAPGPHYAGKSDGWVDDEVDLSRYAGQVIQVRFEYVTNNTIADQGFLLDDIRVPELAWVDDVETPDAGWQADGFLRTGQLVEQGWSLTVIRQGAAPEVQRIPVAAGRANLKIEAPDEGVIILVSAMAPFTLQAASYRLHLLPLR
jgi:hypothetical protein